MNKIKTAKIGQMVPGFEGHRANYNDITCTQFKHYATVKSIRQEAIPAETPNKI